MPDAVRRRGHEQRDWPMRKARVMATFYRSAKLTSRPSSTARRSPSPCRCSRAAAIRIRRRWTAEAALDALARDARSTCMVPTMFRQLLALPAERRRAFRAPALRAVSGPTDLVAHGGDVAMRRAGRPEDVGDFVAFLLSERVWYLTGTLMNIDGGTDF